VHSTGNLLVVVCIHLIKVRDVATNLDGKIGDPTSFRKPVTRGATFGGGVHQENIHLLFYLSTFWKKEGFLCFTPPENEFGSQLFWILGSSSTFRLFRSYKLVRVQKSKWQVS